MPNRTFCVEESYRYGFNGKEKENDAKAIEGGLQEYGGRDYDPAVGRFLSVDPIARSYPELSPYQFAGGSPITFNDLDGFERAWRNPVTGETKPAGPILYSLLDGTKDANGWILFSPPVSSQAPAKSPYLKVAEIEVIEQDISGNVHTGKKSEVQSEVQHAQAEYNEAVGENIRGGLFGAVGYLIEGDKGSFKGAVVDQTLMAFSGVPGSSSVLNRESLVAPPPKETFAPPKVYLNSRGELTNGKYTIDQTGMEPHTQGDLSSGKSQFLFNVDANKAVLDAAIYADMNKLWNTANNSAKVPITNGKIGVLGKTGEKTDYINVYRTNTGFVHGSPGNPPKNP